MARAALPLPTGFYQSVSRALLDKRLINMYLRIIQIPEGPLGFSVAGLFGTEGTREFLDTGLGGPTRGGIIADSIPYFIIRNTLVEVASGGTFILRGTISGTTSHVSMAFNTKTIAIVDPAGASYFYTVATQTLDQIIDPVFVGMGQARHVTIKVGFFVFNTDKEFFNSSPVSTNDGQSFDSLDFGSANIAPDDIVAVHTNHNQLYVIGTRTTEIYQNIQTVGFPFQRRTGANIEIGCSSRPSIIQFVNSFAMLGAGQNELPAIWLVSDSSIEKISTPAIEQIIHSYSEEEISNMTGDVHAINGSYFATWSIGSNTFRYDRTASAMVGTPIWIEVQTGPTSGFGFKRWRGQHIVKAFGKLLVGDTLTGKIGQMDPNHFFELGDRIQRVVTFQPFGTGKRTFVDEIELFIEAGVGNSDSPDPQWLLSYSDDGSKTFTNPIPEPMGKQGEYETQLTWTRMGSFPINRVIKFETDDPVKIAILKAEGELDV